MDDLLHLLGTGKQCRFIGCATQDSLGCDIAVAIADMQRESPLIFDR